MIFPEYLKIGDTVGVTAVSDGVGDPLDKVRFEHAKQTLADKGVDVWFTNDVFQVEHQGRSASGIQRAEEFNGLLNNEKVSTIISAKGGNFLNEMLPYVDFEKLVAHPRWFQGFSDNTCLTHILTTKYDIASVYGSNFSEFGMENWHESVKNNFALLSGEKIVQKSFSKYQDGFGDRITGLEGYSEDKDVCWKLDDNTLKKTNHIEVSGRLIGGCLDVLLFLQGTHYDGTEQFLEKYKEDGIIWYLESFETNAENMMMYMWKLKELGWFKYTKAMMFGRELFYRASMETSYEEACMYALGSLDIPVVFGCDFGHVGPRFTMINGAKATLKVDGKKGELSYDS